MVKLVTGASVEILEKDSENIFQIIQSRYKGLTSSIKVLKNINSHLGQVITAIEIKQYYNIIKLYQGAIFGGKKLKGVMKKQKLKLYPVMLDNFKGSLIWIRAFSELW